MENNNKNSKTLDEKLETHVDPNLLEKLKTLKALGIDGDLLLSFQEKVENILNSNPEAGDIIIGECDKTIVGVECLMQDYNDKFRSILIAGSDNEDYLEGNISSEIDILAQFNEEIASNDDDFDQDLNKAA
ncbi:MAG: hypothetical protein NWP80_01745 [Candidatus Gracilibacteria bacterium]|nr:hypothetical protein [Candidatus Gracilibacteria bacterium]